MRRHNPTDQAPIAGTASYNVTHTEAGSFFTKIDCFCFELQSFATGETVLMPVTYFVDPRDRPRDRRRQSRCITITPCSLYPFHATDIPED